MDEAEEDPYADGQVRWKGDDGAHSVLECHCDLAVKNMPGAGRGLVAMAPLKMGTELLGVRVYASGRDAYDILEEMLRRRVPEARVTRNITSQYLEPRLRTMSYAHARPVV